MNPPRCDDLDYIHFLIAAQKVFTCTEAAREGLALPISAWGIAEHAVHQLPGCRDVSKAAKS
jgi:hypothetical protein